MIFKILSLADIVSYKPYISSFNYDRYKSNLGIFFGLLCIMTIVGTTIFFIAELITKKEITLLYNEIKIDNKPVNLNKSPFMFSLRDPINFPVSKEFYEIKVHFWNYTKNKGFNITELILEPCNLNYHFGEFKEIFTNTDLSNEYCMNNTNDLNLLGSNGNNDSPYSFINIVVNKCNNKTNNNTCAPDKILEAKLKNVYLSFQYINNQINHYNHSYPIQPVINKGLLAFNWDLHSRYLYYLRNIIYNTDNGLIFDSSDTQENYIFDKIDQIVSIRHGSALYPDLTIGTMSIVANEICGIYNKSYPKLQTIIARIGGIINFIVTITQIILHIYTKNLFLIDMMNHNFKTEEGNQSITTIKNTVENQSNIKIISNEKIEKTIKRKFSIFDKICPNFIRKQSDNVKEIKIVESIIQKKLSFEDLLMTQIWFENFKSILINDERFSRFDIFSKLNLDEFNNKLSTDQEIRLNTNAKFLKKNSKKISVNEINTIKIIKK